MLINNQENVNENINEISFLYIKLTKTKITRVWDNGYFPTF